MNIFEEIKYMENEKFLLPEGMILQAKMRSYWRHWDLIGKHILRLNIWK